MSYMVVLVVNDVEQCPPILDAWEEAGVLGVTILASSGLGHIRKAALRDDVSLLPNLEDLFNQEEVQHRTLFSVVETQETVDKMVAIVDQIIGDLDNPNTGFLFVLPVLQAHGFGRHRKDRSKE
jgi:nitrogen regulatory protein P-II 1